MRRLATLAVVGLTVGAVALPASAEFHDDDGRPGELALEWLGERGVIDGCDPPANRSSCPTEPITRVQAAKVLVRLGRLEGFLAESRPGTVDHFSDDDEVWEGAADEFTNHLADVRVIHGCDPPANESFCPYETLRRGQITKMVVRAFGLNAPTTYRTPWGDTEQHFFHEAARVAAYHGLFDASAGEFDGYADVTRAEFARIVVAVFEPDLCRESPFAAARVADLEAEHPAIDFTAYAYDFETGCSYAMNPQARQQTASVFKVMVIAGTLLEAQSDGRSLSGTELGWLEPMITESSNPPVRHLWRSFGGAPWFARQTEIFGMTETSAVGDYQGPWGRTTTSAYDQGDLLRQVLLGEGGILDASYRQVAFELMTSVVSSQTWGVTRGVPDGWTVAQKNGFAGRTANSVGIVYDAAGEPAYVAAILTFGWPAWQQGVDSVEQIGGWISSTFAD